MIFIILALTTITSVTSLDDFFAVKIPGVPNGKGFKVFTRLGNSTTYVNEKHNRVLYQEDGGNWKIGKCKNTVNFTVYYEKTGDIQSEEQWFDIRKSKNINISAKPLKKGEVITGFGFQGSKGRGAPREDCLTSDYWGDEYPNENVFVWTPNSECFYGFDNTTTLYENPNGKLFIHPAIRAKEYGKDYCGIVTTRTSTTNPSNGHNNIQEESNHKSTTDEGENNEVNTGSKLKETPENKENTPLQLIIYICSGVGAVVILGVLAVVLCVGARTRRRKRNEMTVDENVLYDDQRYDDGKTEIGDRNDYYDQ